MSSKSEKQRNFFKLVKAIKSGVDIKVSDSVRDAAKNMTMKQIDDYIKECEENIKIENFIKRC